MLLRACRFGVTVLLLPALAWARSNGIATSACNGCHVPDEGVSYDGIMTLEPIAALEPGQKTEFTLHVEESHMKGAGYFITAGGKGAFSAGTGNRVSGDSVLHTQPASSTDGTVDIVFSWTPPSEPGGADIEVFLVAANIDRKQTGDIPVAARYSFAFGCDPITLHEDIDGDGFGTEDSMTTLDCADREGWTSKLGDCNDLWASIYPDAPETLNAKDDDCDGEIDEGIEVFTWYADADGDGFGYGSGIESETALEGYATVDGDCDDANPDVSPEGIEICDGLDNDCNRKLDDGEGVFIRCGQGICARTWEICDTECVPGAPQMEVCDGLDDDCDGEVDEEVTCPEGSQCSGGTCTPTNQSSEAPAATTSQGSNTGIDAGPEVSSSSSGSPDASPSPSVLSSSADENPTTENPETSGRDAPDSSGEDNPASPRDGGCDVSGKPSGRWSWALVAFGVFFRTRRHSRVNRSLFRVRARLPRSE